MEMRTLWINDGVVIQTCWHYINVFFPASGFISVILVCNASGTPELCSHTCSQKEFSEGSTEARWTVCQTHLDFCLSYFRPHSHPAQLLVNAAETCDFPKYREEGGRASEGRSLQHYLSQMTNIQIKQMLCFLCLCVCCRTVNVTAPLPCALLMCTEWKCVYLNVQIHSNWHVKHTLNSDA